MKSIIKEACVETFEQSQNAQFLGADRIELCADLNNDGLTPSMDLIVSVKTALSIPIRVMVRPRSGDFCYSEEEIKKMKVSINQCKIVGVEGVVFGACNSQNELDIDIISDLADSARSLKITIHKAIDSCKDPIRELKKLIKLGKVHSVLTSGKAATALEGESMLKKMVNVADKAIEVIACGKVTNENLEHIDELIRAKAYHGKLIVGQLN